MWLQFPNQNLICDAKPTSVASRKTMQFLRATTCSNNVELVEGKHYRIDGPLPNATEQSQTSERSKQHHVQSVHEKMKIGSKNSRATSKCYGTRKDARYLCPYSIHCPYSSSHKSHMQNHIESVHDKVKPFRRFKCQVCPFSSLRRSRLEEHVKVCVRALRFQIV